MNFKIDQPLKRRLLRHQKSTKVPPKMELSARGTKFNFREQSHGTKIFAQSFKTPTEICPPFIRYSKTESSALDHFVIVCHRFKNKQPFPGETSIPQSLDWHCWHVLSGETKGETLCFVKLPKLARYVENKIAPSGNPSRVW